MKSEIISLPGFYILGIATRTTNKGGRSQIDIGELWKRFFAEDLFLQIPRRSGDDIYCLYTDFEQGGKAYYTAILGAKVQSLENTPELMLGKTIPAQHYLRFQSIGKLPDCVQATWAHIWNSTLPRAFQADFDVYGPAASNPLDAVVETFVSVA